MEGKDEKVREQYAQKLSQASPKVEGTPPPPYTTQPDCWNIHFSREM